MKQLPSAQLRVLRAIANREVITARYGIWFVWRPHYRHDGQIFRKLVRRGYLATQVVQRGYGWSITEMVTEKGWRACGLAPRPSQFATHSEVQP